MVSVFLTAGWRRLPPVAVCDPEGTGILRLSRSGSRETQTLNRVSAPAPIIYMPGPVLVLPVGEQLSYGFDPNHVLSVDESSTVYEGGQVSDVWGVLRAPGGFLIVRGANGVMRVQVPAPADAQERPLKGEGWTMELSPGWTLGPGPRPGDFTLKQN